jgi:hypothetical protein
MALTDEEFDEMMTVKGEKPPEFYSTYVAEVQRIIELNAKLEFECLWRHKQKTGMFGGGQSAESGLWGVPCCDSRHLFLGFFFDLPARLLFVPIGGYICLATDQLSTKITTLRDSIGASEVLWGNNDLRIKVRYCRSHVDDAFLH